MSYDKGNKVSKNI